MAILKGIEVSVVIDGKALVEYDDEDAANKNADHPSEVSKYIEAVPDAEFSIDITMSQSYDLTADGLSFRLSLDGVTVRDSLCTKVELKGPRKDWQKRISGSKVEDGKECYLRPFKFNDIKIVEASTSTAGSGKSNDVAKLGTITLNVFDVKITGKRKKASKRTASLGQSSEIAEKELKGRNVTLQSSFGESRSSKRSQYYKSKRLNEKPIFSFEFKYRSKKALQGLRLIPMTPSPSPVPTPVPLEERSFDSLTPDEAKYQAEREANIKLEKTKSEQSVKREANIKPENIKSERGVKKEHDHEYEDMIKSSTAKRVKTRPFEKGETIKLD